MNDDEARALGERWIKAGGGWRLWMRGVDLDGEAWRIGNDGEAIRERGLEVRYSGLLRPRLWPDLRDPATRGAALDVVRDRWGGTVWIGGQLVRPGRLAWIVCGLHVSNGQRVNGPDGFKTEAEALVAALEARALRKQIRSLLTLGVSIHKHADLAITHERARVNDILTRMASDAHDTGNDAAADALALAALAVQA